MKEASGGPRYRVTRNSQEQFSIWPGGQNLPAGWTDAGKEGSREECLAYIEDAWKDMRPLSLRQQTAGSNSR
ncbi:MAG: MbtH family NRPS accessory protein [Acidobacteriia bacterium]|nr:MbtH family NRPS accessory protein [Terriglobia bacterium]